MYNCIIPGRPLYMRSGFTLIELILVIFIMALLTVMTVPMLSQFVKTSKVDQTVKIVTDTLYRARVEAMRTRKLVGVFFGDDPLSCKTQPTPGVLPPKGRIEIWTVKDNYALGDFTDESGSVGGAWPYNNQGAWYPFRYPDRCLSPEPITFPDGIRILVGCYKRTASPPSFSFGWPSDYAANGDGEIKRHTITFARQGAMAGSYDGLNSWWEILIFDEQTGNNVVMSAGEWLCTSKPRVLPIRLTSLIGVSGTTFPIVKTADIANYVEK